MNVAELEEMLDDACHCIDLGCGWSCDAYIADRLIRRVIAAGKLVEALHTARDYVSDSHIGALVYDDGKRVSEAMTTEDLSMIDAALATYEATK